MYTAKRWMFAAGVAVIAGCHGRAVAPPPPAVVVAEIAHAYPGATAGARYPVEVVSRYANPMSFRVAGKLIERDVRLGDRVKKGQIVARLDPADAERQAVAARAARDAAEHRLKFAKQQLDRDTAQSAANLISVTQMEQTDDAYVAALAARDQAAAQQAVADDNLRYQTLTADHDGSITAENADTGQVVAAGQPVFGLAWSGDMDVVLDAAAADLPAFTVGRHASVGFPSIPGRVDALIREVSPAADPQSRTYRIKLQLTHPDAAIRLGMSGDAELIGSGPGGDTRSVALPATALFHRGREPAVWIVRRPAASGEAPTLELRPVTVSGYSERVVSIASGVRDGEQVVVAGVHTVFEGERVAPVKPLFAAENDAEHPGETTTDAASPPAPAGVP